MKKIIELVLHQKLIVLTIVLVVSMIEYGDAQDTIFSDTCGSEAGWTLDSTSTASYIKWRVNNECSINGGALAVNAFKSSTPTWLCEYWWDVNNAAGIVAHKTVNATTAHTLTLKFDWKSIGEWIGSTI